MDPVDEAIRLSIEEAEDAEVKRALSASVTITTFDDEEEKVKISAPTKPGSPPSFTHKSPSGKKLVVSKLCAKMCPFGRVVDLYARGYDLDANYTDAIVRLDDLMETLNEYRAALTQLRSVGR